MSLGTTAASWALKTLFEDGANTEVLVRNKPLMQWAPNKTNFTSSRGIEIPAPYVNPQGIATTNATAAANEVASQGKSFLLPQRTHVAFGKIDGIVVRNAMEGGDASHFVDSVEREVDGVTESIGVEIHQRMYGSKNGIRSLLSSTAAINTTTWTLANEEDAQFFEPGMKLVLVNPSTGNVRSGTAVSVVSVNGTTMVCSANPDTFTSAAAGDGIAREGSANGSGGVDLDGLAGWCPATAPTSGDSFLGVDRSAYPARLAGVRVDISGDTIRGGFIKAKAKAAAQVGSMFDSKEPIFINPKNLAQIMQSVEAAKIVDIKLDDSYGIGLDAVSVMGHKFVQDSMCPVNVAWLVGSKSWVRYSCGKQPAFESSDGQDFWFDRSSGNTGVLNFVMNHDGNTGSPAVYNIMRMTLPSAVL